MGEKINSSRNDRIFFSVFRGWVRWYWGLNRAFVLARQVLYHFSHASSVIFFPLESPTPHRFSINCDRMSNILLIHKARLKEELL
jgi:hypothetical protein